MGQRLPSDARLLPAERHDVRFDLKASRMIVGAWIGADRHRRYLSYPLPADLAQDLMARRETHFPIEDYDVFTV